MTAEADRRDLYNRLEEVIGPKRAGTLMAHLPTHQYDDLATSKRVEEVERSLTARIDRLEADMNASFDRVNQRIDRLVLTLIAGMFALTTAIIATGLF